jgi:hypothetical protein
MGHRIMKQVTNCKNCGAALDIWKPHCEFCGTKNVNLTALDLNSGEPANFIFKMPSNMRVVDKNGADIYLSLLAVPSLEMIEMTNDTMSIYNGWNGKYTYTQNTGMEMGIKLTTVCAPEKENILCELRYGDKK